MPGVVVRTAVPAELPVLDRELPSGRNDVHAAFLARQAAGDAVYLVAWLGPVPVGTGVVRWAGGRPEITNLQVPPERQGRGVGTALVRAAEDVVRSRGHAQVVIGVAEDNPRAAALYERLGYRDTGERGATTYTYFDEAGVAHQVTEHDRILALDLS